MEPTPSPNPRSLPLSGEKGVLSIVPGRKCTCEIPRTFRLTEPRCWRRQWPSAPPCSFSGANTDGGSSTNPPGKIFWWEIGCILTKSMLVMSRILHTIDSHVSAKTNRKALNVLEPPVSSRRVTAKPALLHLPSSPQPFRLGSLRAAGGALGLLLIYVRWAGNWCWCWCC